MPPTCFDLLRVISDARFHSGQTLARELGTSRASVSRLLRQLEQFGLKVLKAPGRGCRLVEPYDFLNAAMVRAKLGPQAAQFRLKLLDSCSSTNTLLLEQARAGAPLGSVIACELQSSGRGRRGNNWQSGLGGSLTFSLLWRFSRGVGALTGLSLAAGVAVARALSALGAGDAQLKWPNDVLHDGCKLGGILIEVQGTSIGPSAAVIGIGLNLRLHQGLRDAIAQPVTDVASMAAKLPQRSLLLAAVLAQLAQVLPLFAERGFAPLREEWTRRHAHQGKVVTLSSGDGRVEVGRAAGVDQDGALLIDTARGIERFLSGELSLRAA